jgi:hypothetical protein
MVEPRKSVFSFISAEWLLISLAIGCSPAPAISPSIRRASQAAPCPKQQAASKLVPIPSELTAPQSDARSVSAVSGPFSGGGYLSIRFFGVDTNSELFKAPMQHSDSNTIQYGNPSGIVDVLHIPYCTETVSRISRERLRQCVSRMVWDALVSNPSAMDQILSRPWTPKAFTKECTAMVTQDSSDRRSNGAMSRLRVWTAEHCFQPSYTIHAVLKAFVAGDDPSTGKYVSLPLHDVDSLRYVQRVVTAGGGRGDAGDLRLKEKIFILRSLDARTAKSYQSALVSGCLKPNWNNVVKESSLPAKYVDCFTTADMATFKASLDESRFTDLDSEKMMPSERKFTPAAISDARKKALSILLRLNGHSEDSRVKLGFENTGFLASASSFLGRTVGFSEMLTSLFDGVQHARRHEAMEFERSSSGVAPGLVLSQLNELSEIFSSLRFDYSKSDLDELSRLVDQATGGLVSLGCRLGLTPGELCGGYMMTPPDTARLEELALGSRFDAREFISKRLQVYLLKVLNSSFPETHPWRINSNDSDALANAKMGAIWTRVTFEAATLRKEPFKEVPAFGALTQSLQSVLLRACPDASLVNDLFPVFANMRFGGNTVFGKASILGSSSHLKILPLVRAGVVPPEFLQGTCSAATSLLSDLGQGREVYSSFMPNDAVIGVDADDSALALPAETSAMEYMSRRAVYKFEGANGKDLKIAHPSDSGMGWTALGMPAFVLSSHNYALTNGVVFTEMPDINTTDPDAGVNVDAKGKAVINCNGK